MKKYLKQAKISRQTPIQPCPVVMIIDSTFWNRTHGIIVARVPKLKRKVNGQNVLISSDRDLVCDFVSFEI